MGRDITEDSLLINENDDNDGKSVEIVSPRGEKDGIVKKMSKSHTENGIIGLLNNGGHRGNSFGVGALHGGSSSHESESDEHGHRGKVDFKNKNKKKNKKKQKFRKKKKKKKFPTAISVVHDVSDSSFPGNPHDSYSDNSQYVINDNYWPETDTETSEHDHYNLIDLVDMLPDPPTMKKQKKKMKKMKKMKGKPGKHKYGRAIGGSVGGLPCFSFYPLITFQFFYFSIYTI